MTAPWGERSVGGHRTVSLQEVLATAALQDRVDRKYLLDRETAEALLSAVGSDHRVLALEDRRSQAYSTVYLDGPGLPCHLAHVQGRRRRWKARTRRYLDGDLTRLELKTKGLRGRTVKVSTELRPDAHGRVDDGTTAFVDEQLHLAYGTGLQHDLVPVLEVAYRRTTLVSDDGGSRLTLDTDLQVLRTDGSAVGRLRPRSVLVETKSGARPGVADRVLRELGVREASCSKYCVGTALAEPALPSAPFRPLLRRWFEATAPVAADDLVAAAA